MQQRVVVQEIDRPREIRPSHFTPDLFTGAPRPVIDHDMHNLASALTAFGASVSSFASSMAKQQPTAEDMMKAQLQQLEMTRGSKALADQFASGQLPGAQFPKASGWAAQRAGEVDGQAAFDRLNTLMEGGNFPLIDEKGQRIDVDAALGAFLKDHFRSTNPHYTAGFHSRFEAARSNLLSRQTKAVADYNERFYTLPALDSKADELFAKVGGMDDALVNQSINSIVESAKQELNASPLLFEQRLMGRIKNAVDKTNDPKALDAAERLLYLDRTGYDGVKPGPLAAKYRQDADTILTTINKKRSELYDRGMEDHAVNVAVEALKRGDGSIHRMEDLYYQNEVVKQRFPGEKADRYLTAGSIKEKAAARLAEESRRLDVAQGVNPATSENSFNRDYGLFVGNNIPNKAWKTALEHSTRSLTDPTSASDPNFVKTLLANERLYATLMERSPGYVKETLRLGDREQRFFDMVGVYRDIMGKPPEIAVQSAIRYVNTSHEGVDHDARKAVEEEVKKIDLNGWSWGGKVGSWGPSWANTQAIKRELTQTALAIAADRDISPDKAVEAARELTEKRYVMINGQAIRSPHITQEKLTWVERALKDQFKQHEPAIAATYGIKSADQLSIRPDAGGYFTIVTSEGEPITVPVVSKDGQQLGHRLLQINANDINSIGTVIRDEMMSSAAASAKKARDQADRKAFMENAPVQTPTGPKPLLEALSGN